MKIYINYVFFDIQKMNENSLVKKKMSVICGEVKTAALTGSRALSCQPGVCYASGSILS